MADRGSQAWPEEVEVQTTGVEVRSVADYVVLACVDCGRVLDRRLLAANLHRWMRLAEAHRCRAARE